MTEVSNKIPLINRLSEGLRVPRLFLFWELQTQCISEVAATAVYAYSIYCTILIMLQGQPLLKMMMNWIDMALVDLEAVQPGGVSTNNCVARIAFYKEHALP